MKISTKGEYGLRALIELAQRYGEGYIQSSQIASSRNIPENYLYQLLITLRKAGMIRSRRGPQGGHMLARPPESITVTEAVLALEGPLSPVLCVENMMDDCPFHDYCAMRGVWGEITEAIRDILDRTTLQMLVERERANRAQNPKVLP